MGSAPGWGTKIPQNQEVKEELGTGGRQGKEGRKEGKTEGKRVYKREVGRRLLISKQEAQQALGPVSHMKIE